MIHELMGKQMMLVAKAGIYPRNRIVCTTCTTKCNVYAISAPNHIHLKNNPASEANRQKRMQTHNSSNTATVNPSVVKFV